MMPKNPERWAWLVLFGAFAIFLMLCAAIPVSARSYLLYTSHPEQATLEVSGGTVRVQEQYAAAPMAVTKSLQVSEGSIIETDETSRGILTLFDGSTVTLFPSTQVNLRQMRESTFEWGRVPITLMIQQMRGRIRVGVAPLYTPAGATAHQRVFQVYTDDMLAVLSSDGSFAFDVIPEVSSQVTTNDGTAEVVAQGRSVVLTRRQRTVVTRGNSPLPSLPAALDLIVNGDFKDPPDRGWNSLPGPKNGIPAGQVDVTPLGDRETIHIYRTNSEQTSAIAGIIQQINREVSDLHTMKLSADIRLHAQSLSGGGYLSSEYPLILRLRYRDEYGSEGEWVHGFYFQNTTNNPTLNGEQVPQDVWVPFESGNLFEIADPRPFVITSLQIYASGWDYDAYVSSIRLIVE